MPKPAALRRHRPCFAAHQTTMSDPKKRDEGIALILGVRLLQVLIIFMLWLIMR
jgi:hypothetical protein